MKPPRLTVEVWGAMSEDSPAWRFAKALEAAGHRFATETLCPYPTTARLMAETDMLPEADLLLIALTGSELRSAVTGLTTGRAWRAGQLVAHTDPQFGHEVLDMAAEEGVLPMAIAPINSLYTAVSAPYEILAVAQALALEAGAEPVVIKDGDHAMFYEALTVARDYSTLVVKQAIGLLDSIGIEDARGMLESAVYEGVEEAFMSGSTPLDFLGEVPKK